MILTINEQIKETQIFISNNHISEEQKSYYRSVLNSLETAKNAVDSDMDFHIATFHKDKYEIFVKFLELDKRTIKKLANGVFKHKIKRNHGKNK